MIDTNAGLYVLAEVAQNLAFLDVLGPTDMPDMAEIEVVQSISYHGSCSGTVFVGLSPGLAESVAITLLGDPSQKTIDKELMLSAAGELTNVVVGNIGPLLDKRDGEIRLDPPQTAQFPDAFQCHPHLALATSEGVIAMVIIPKEEYIQ